MAPRKPMRSKRTAYSRSSVAKRKRKSTISRSVTTNVIRGRGPVAPRTIVRLKYNDKFSSDGTNMDYVWNANSIFDPDRSGTGHQPYGHDTYLALYNRYRVFRCDYNFRVGFASGTSISFKIVHGCTNDPNRFNSASLASESPQMYTAVATNGANNRFKGSINLPFINGKTALKYKTDDNNAALMGASPAETLCLHIVHADLAGSAPASGAVLVDITLIFHVEMFDAHQLSAS